MKVLIAGSRTYNDYEEFKDILNYLLEKFSDIEIVSGGAKGADRLAERYAKSNNLKLTIFKAQWDLYGKSAGFRRNEEMHNYINDSEDKLCICFWDGESHGTAHNFKLCKRYDTSLIVYDFVKHKNVTEEVYNGI